jgi:hypothetical protein
MWGEPWGDFSMQVDRAPRKVPGAAGIAKIACGAFHNLALTRCPAALSPPRSGACLLPHVVRVGPHAQSTRPCPRLGTERGSGWRMHMALLGLSMLTLPKPPRRAAASTQARQGASVIKTRTV